MKVGLSQIITPKEWSFAELVQQASAAGYECIEVKPLDGSDLSLDTPEATLKDMARLAADEGIEIVSLCRGGFFPATDAAARQRAIDDNLKAIDEAEALDAPLIVLVCGADPGQPLAESRQQIVDGIGAVLDRAGQAGVKLAIEPLHPMYADTRSAVNTLRQANEMCEQLDSPLVGVAVDVYHLWWDPDLQSEIQRSGRADRIFAFHVCDWRSPTEDLLNDRGLMGEGCINVPQIRGWVEENGFNGFIEVEIFSNRYWAMDQGEFLEKIKRAYSEKT